MSNEDQKGKPGTKKKNIFLERFNKMLEEQRQKDEEKKNKIKNEANKQNFTSNNIVKEAINNQKKKEEDLKEKNIQAQKEEEEKEQRIIAMEKKREEQRIKLEKEKELQRQKEEEKRLKEEQKKQRDKEWKEQMDKDRLKYLTSSGNESNWIWNIKEKVKSYDRSSHKICLGDGEKTYIYIDLTTKTLQYFFCRFEDTIKGDIFPNCIVYLDDDIYRMDKCDIGTTHLRGFHRPELLKKKYPVSNGNISDFNVLELLINYALKVKVGFITFEESSILFAEPLKCLKEEREKFAKIFFEDYYVNRLFLIKPSILALLSEGKNTGIVIELGEDTTNFIPILENSSIQYAIISPNLGRKDMIEYMKDLIKEKEKIMISSNDKIEKIIEETCYVALDYEFEEKYNVYSLEFELEETNQKIHIKEPRIKCPEILFSPKICRYTSCYKSIQEYLLDSINKCDKDLKDELLKNIVLTGVNSKIRGLKERLTKEICSKLNLQENEVGISINEKGVKEGVEKLFSDPLFEGTWVTREEYQNDEEFVNNKFF